MEMTMDIGMMWFDNDQAKGIEVRIQKAAAYYRKKYGQNPSMCFVHPSMKQESRVSDLNGIHVQTSNKMLPGHFWIGMGNVS